MIQDEEEIRRQEIRVSSELETLKAELADEDLSLKARAATLKEIHDKEIAHKVLRWILGDSTPND